MLPPEEDELGASTGGIWVSQIGTASLSESGMDGGFPGSHGKLALQAKKSPKTLLATVSGLTSPQDLRGHSSRMEWVLIDAFATEMIGIVLTVAVPALKN